MEEVIRRGVEFILNSKAVYLQYMRNREHLTILLASPSDRPTLLKEFLSDKAQALHIVIPETR